MTVSSNIHWKHFLGYLEYFLRGGMEFVSVQSSPGNLSVFKIIRALVLLSQTFQMQKINVLRKWEFF